MSTEIIIAIAVPVVVSTLAIISKINDSKKTKR